MKPIHGTFFVALTLTAFVLFTPNLSQAQTWDSVGSGTNKTINALYTFGGSLYAGGSFGTAGGVTATRIANWNGTNWQGVASGIANAGVWALGSNNSTLYARGLFTKAGG